MRDGVPIPGSVRDRLVRAAIEEFSRLGYEGVHVGVLCEAAGVTTGALYHHFGGKQELYELVRADVERRVVDRMAGAAAAMSTGPDPLRAALLVGFDYALDRGFVRMLGEARPLARDEIAETLAELTGSVVLGAMLAAAWRVALAATANGAPLAEVRGALGELNVEQVRSKS